MSEPQKCPKCGRVLTADTNPTGETILVCDNCNYYEEIVK